MWWVKEGRGEVLAKFVVGGANRVLGSVDDSVVGKPLFQRADDSSQSAFNQITIGSSFSDGC